MSLNYKIQYPRIVDSEAVSHTTAQAMVIMMLSHPKQVSKKEWTIVCTADALLAKAIIYLCSSFVNLRS